ncbi:MAG: hypothetical protein GY730_11095, partial [bacterium]|nr:hypothetical protein [bacterium]
MPIEYKIVNPEEKLNPDALNKVQKELQAAKKLLTKLEPLKTYIEANSSGGLPEYEGLKKTVDYLEEQFKELKEFKHIYDTAKAANSIGENTSPDQQIDFLDKVLNGAILEQYAKFTTAPVNIDALNKYKDRAIEIKAVISKVENFTAEIKISDIPVDSLGTIIKTLKNPAYDNPLIKIIEVLHTSLYSILTNKTSAPESYVVIKSDIAPFLEFYGDILPKQIRLKAEFSKTEFDGIENFSFKILNKESASSRKNVFLESLKKALIPHLEDLQTGLSAISIAFKKLVNDLGGDPGTGELHSNADSYEPNIEKNITLIESILDGTIPQSIKDDILRSPDFRIFLNARNKNSSKTAGQVLAILKENLQQKLSSLKEIKEQKKAAQQESLKLAFKKLCNDKLRADLDPGSTPVLKYNIPYDQADMLISAIDSFLEDHIKNPQLKGSPIETNLYSLKEKIKSRKDFYNTDFPALLKNEGIKNSLFDPVPANIEVIAEKKESVANIKKSMIDSGHFILENGSLCETKGSVPELQVIKSLETQLYAIESDISQQKELRQRLDSNVAKLINETIINDDDTIASLKLKIQKITDGINFKNNYFQEFKGLEKFESLIAVNTPHRNRIEHNMQKLHNKLFENLFNSYLENNLSSSPRGILLSDNLSISEITNKLETIQKILTSTSDYYEFEDPSFPVKKELESRTMLTTVLTSLKSNLLKLKSSKLDTIKTINEDQRDRKFSELLQSINAHSIDSPLEKTENPFKDSIPDVNMIKDFREQIGVFTSFCSEIEVEIPDIIAIRIEGLYKYMNDRENFNAEFKKSYVDSDLQPVIDKAGTLSPNPAIIKTIDQTQTTELISQVSQYLDKELNHKFKDSQEIRTLKVLKAQLEEQKINIRNADFNSLLQELNANNKGGFNITVSTKNIQTLKDKITYSVQYFSQLTDQQRKVLDSLSSSLDQQQIFSDDCTLQKNIMQEYFTNLKKQIKTLPLTELSALSVTETEKIDTKIKSLQKTADNLKNNLLEPVFPTKPEELHSLESRLSDIKQEHNNIKTLTENIVSLNADINTGEINDKVELLNLNSPDKVKKRADLLLTLRSKATADSPTQTLLKKIDLNLKEIDTKISARINLDNLFKTVLKADQKTGAVSDRQKLVKESGINEIEMRQQAIQSFRDKYAEAVPQDSEVFKVLENIDKNLEKIAVSIDTDLRFRGDVKAAKQKISDQISWLKENKMNSIIFTQPGFHQIIESLLNDHNVKCPVNNAQQEALLKYVNQPDQQLLNIVIKNFALSIDQPGLQSALKTAKTENLKIVAECIAKTIQVTKKSKAED